jgi:hypothetical protein
MRLKTEIVQLRLTPDEKEALKALAAKKQMSQSEYLRWLIARESASL